MNLVENRIEDNGFLEIAASSIIGTRKYQQDYACIYSDRNEVFGIICDGMGGLNGGEQASKNAAELFVKDYLSRDKKGLLQDFLVEEAGRMDRLVAGLKDEKGKALKAGTTVVAAIVKKNKFFWLSVGDSKIYVIRGRSIKAITREHNYRLTLFEDLQKGRITKQQFESEKDSRQAEALISYLGMNGLELIDVPEQPFILMDGDIILLCSDGIYKSLDESQIHAMIRDNDIAMEIAAERLTAMALMQARGGQDNTTAVLIAYHEAGIR